MSDTKVDFARLCREIDAGRESITVDNEGAHFATSLARYLERHSWVEYETYSECSKATAEFHLQKGNRRVDITSAFFLGSFVQIICWTKVRS